MSFKRRYKKVIDFQLWTPNINVGTIVSLFREALYVITKSFIDAQRESL